MKISGWGRRNLSPSDSMAEPVGSRDKADTKWWSILVGSDPDEAFNASEGSLVFQRYRFRLARLYLASGCAFVISFILFIYVALVFNSDKTIEKLTFWATATIYLCLLLLWWTAQWLVLHYATWALASQDVLNKAREARWSRFISYLRSYSELPEFEPPDASSTQFTAHANININEAHALFRRLWWLLWFPLFLVLMMGLGWLISLIPGVDNGIAAYLSMVLPHMALLFVCQFNWGKIASLVDQHEAGPHGDQSVMDRD